jgi:predicted protein tyrosine phosphatase
MTAFSPLPHRSRQSTSHPVAAEVQSPRVGPEGDDRWARRLRRIDSYVVPGGHLVEIGHQSLSLRARFGLTPS